MLPQTELLLKAIRALDVYDDAQWQEYVGYFEQGETLRDCRPAESELDGGELGQRILRGLGATPATPAFGASPKIQRWQDLAQPEVRGGLTLGVVSGAFDLLHTGHLRGMQEARQRLGDAPRAKLCAMVLSDRHIREKKGASRPILDINQRLALLCDVRGIDYVVPLDEPDGLAALNALRPDYFYKSPTDLDQDIVKQEIELVTAFGGQFELFTAPAPDRTSTTNLVEQTRQRYGHSPRPLPPLPDLSVGEMERTIRFAQTLSLSRHSLLRLYDCLLETFQLERPAEWTGAKQARLITFDGHSGAGKDTQIDLLRQYLQREASSRWNIIVLVQKRLDPFRSLVKYLWSRPDLISARDPSFLLLTCGRKYFTDGILAPLLEQSRNLILQNRSYLSQVAYQAMTVKELPSLLELCWFDPQADLRLVLRCDTEVASERIVRRSPTKGGIIYDNERPEYIDRVKRNMEGLQEFVKDLVLIDTFSDTASVAESINSLATSQLLKDETCGR